MSTRTLSVVLLALACGASAAILVSRLRGRPTPAAEAGEALPVVTAAVDVRRGQMLEAKMLKLSHYPKQDVPKGAFTSFDDAIGRTAVFSLVANEPIVTGKLAEKGAGRGLAAMIPNGLRAFTIETPHLASDVGGFLMPGNHVDVLLTTTQGGSETGGGVTATLLQNVQVLAVAQKTEAPEDSKPIQNDIKIVTLLVTPDQAAKLDLGMNKGLLHLALRNPGDDREASTLPATMKDLLFRQEKPVSLADALLGVVAAKSKEPAPPKLEQASYMEIRTLRGLDAGSVRIAVPR